jgi:hypothetical protein
MYTTRMQAALEANDWNLQPAASALLARREQEAAAVAAQADYLRTPSGKLKPIAVPRHSPVSAHLVRICCSRCTAACVPLHPGSAGVQPCAPAPRCSSWHAVQGWSWIVSTRHLLLPLQGASPSRTPDRSPRRRMSVSGLLRRASNAASTVAGEAVGGRHSRQPSADVGGGDGAVPSAAGGATGSGGSQQRTPSSSPTAAEAAGITAGATAVAITGGAHFRPQRAP